jgi:6-phosphogluconate dehydrogenase
MGGGAEDAWARVAPIFEGIAAKAKGRACCARVGPDGAGHFVKTIHNGIEYADMQMIAEAYGLMRDGLELSADRIAAVFAAWNEGPLQSYLIEITARVLEARDPASGGPLIDVIVDKAGQKGTGRWAVIEAQDLGTPATVIEAAVAARSWAADKEARVAGEKLFGGTEGLALDPGSENAFLRNLEAALLAGRIIAYAQGFTVMQAASRQWQWSLPLGTIAEIWRAGCIIRSAFLDDIAAVYQRGEGTDSLMRAPYFANLLKTSEGALRTVVAAGVQSGLAMPAFSAALAAYDYLKTARSTADLIQGQRDFFGAHGFERHDRPGEVAHGPWSTS